MTDRRSHPRVPNNDRRARSGTYAALRRLVDVREALQLVAERSDGLTRGVIESQVVSLDRAIAELKRGDPHASPVDREGVPGAGDVHADRLPAGAATAAGTGSDGVRLRGLS